MLDLYFYGVICMNTLVQFDLRLTALVAMGPTPRRSAGTKFWWSNDLEERLISLWEGTPFLYNIQFRDYANTQKRGLKTIEFAEQLNVPSEYLLLSPIL